MVRTFERKEASTGRDHNRNIGQNHDNNGHKEENVDDEDVV